MKILLSLILKDFKRDWKRPWAIVLFAALPVVMTGLIALIFGRRDFAESVPPIRIAILDQDKDLVPQMLRHFLAQGDAAERVRVGFVETRRQGLRLLEKRKASALVVLPGKMTENLLNGQTTTIEIYENPAEQYLPKVVRQGVSLLAVGLSGVAEGLQNTRQRSPDKAQVDGFATRLELAQAAWRFVQQLRDSLIEFETVAPADYQIQTTSARPSP